MNSTPIIPVDRMKLNDIHNSIKNQSLSLSGNHVDIDSLRPPQPWNRRGGVGYGQECGNGNKDDSFFHHSSNDNNKRSRNIIDANHCVDVINRAHRARIKTYFQSSLKFQSWTHKFSTTSSGTNSTGQQDYEEQQKSTAYNDNNTPHLKEQFPVFNNETPVDKYHYLKQKKKYDSSNYIIVSGRKDRKDRMDMNHLLLASAYRQQRMDSSPLDSYCAPFSIQAVRYGMGLIDNDECDDSERGNQFTHIKNKTQSNTINKRNQRSQNKSQEKNEHIVEDHDSDLSSHNDHDRQSEHGIIVQSDNDNDRNSIKDSMVDTNDNVYGIDEIDSDDTTVKASSYTLKQQKGKRKKKKRRKLTGGLKTNVDECIRYHGNSLSLIPCTCKVCLQSLAKANSEAHYGSDNDDDNHIGPNFFLLHPTGESLSLSFVTLPHGRKRKLEVDASNDGDSYLSNHAHVDVGGKVLQVDSCLDISHLVKQNASIFNDGNFAWTFVARTALHCSVVKVKLKDIPRKKKVTKKQLGDKNEEDYCTGEYDIIEIHRIPLHSNDDKVYYEFLHLAANRQSGSWYGACYPNFAIVCSEVRRDSEHYHHYKRETNIIHNIQINNNGANVQKHCMENLKDIAHIQYSGNHPMVLWAAARSNTNPSLYTGKGSFHRPMIGYGHSLYNIDLRCDKATFTWSPSSEEFMMDGIHSVSGILTDFVNPYTLYVKSLSAGGRLYEIDSRMPSRAIFTWGLPGLSDDFKSRLSSSGIYGPGVLMTQPLDVMGFSNEIQIPVLSINQSPAAFGVQLYQRPRNYPRFHTRNLEAPMMTGLGSRLSTGAQFDTASFATGSSYPISESSNIKGIASFFVNSSQIHKRLGSVGYEHCPERALCVITANSMGDLHAQTLLALPHTETKHAEIVIGNKVGSCAVQIPYSDDDNEQIRTDRFSKVGDMFWRVSNDFPSDSQSILKQHVASRTQCRQFESIQLCHLPHRDNKEMTSNDIDNISFAHPLPCTQFGDLQMDKKPLQMNTKFLQGAEMPEQKLGNSFPGARPATNNRTDLTKESLNKLKEAWTMEESNKLTQSNDDFSSF